MLHVMIDSERPEDKLHETAVPTITIVTPSLNQGRYIEKTIKSVLAQQYPRLQYILVDGGSVDGTMEIVRRYAEHFAWWVSEPDSGQANAINKGFRRSSGEIMGWLNSDDQLAPDALQAISEIFRKEPDTYAVVGHVDIIDQDGLFKLRLPGHYSTRARLVAFWRGYTMHQPSIFWRRDVWERVGELDESLHLSMDFDFWLRVSRFYSFRNVDLVLSRATLHPDAKTSDGFVSYRRAQRRDLLRHFCVPRRISDVPITTLIYGHYLKAMARRLFAKVARKHSASTTGRS